jgi:uncharacterized protein YcbX
MSFAPFDTSDDAPDDTPGATLQALWVYPVKSCAGVALNQALLEPTGIDLDRAWMVVDPEGRMLTQREFPRLALVQPTLRSSEMLLRAPGMLTLHVQIEVVEAPTRVQVWDDIVKAFDMGALAAQWFTDFLGRPARLARFDPDERRLSDPAWTGEIRAENAFSDGFPLLVASTASLADLNSRLAARGQAPVGLQRFRPNLVLDGLRPFDEDLLQELQIATGDPAGPVRLRLVKPCVRCGIPNVDPASGQTGPEPGATLAGFRADPRMQGGITFGMNAVIVSGQGAWLRTGQAVRGRFGLD